MTRDMILYVLAILILSTTCGIFVKLKMLGANGKTLLYAPLIIPLVFVFNFIYALKILKKSKYSNEGYRIFYSVLINGVKSLSLLSGIICMIIVDIQKDIKKNKAKSKDTHRCYRIFENNLNRNYKEILC